jgi:hypothetical protein
VDYKTSSSAPGNRRPTCVLKYPPFIYGINYHSRDTSSRTVKKTVNTFGGLEDKTNDTRIVVIHFDHCSFAVSRLDLSEIDFFVAQMSDAGGKVTKTIV